MMPLRRSLVLAAALAACGTPAPDGLEVGIVPAEPTTVDALTAVLPTLPEGEGVTYAYSWTVDGAASDITTPFVPADRTERGQVWAVAATPTSANGKKVGAVATYETEILNTRPVAGRVLISPSKPTSSDPLTATAEGTDIDGDDITWTYTWYVRNEEVQSSESDTLDIGPYIDRDTVDVVAIPTDGQAEGASVRSAPVLVRNSLPTVSSATITPAETPAHGFTELACDEGDLFDQDGDEITLHYDWTVDGTFVGMDSPIVDRIARRDQEVQCYIRGFDGKELGEWAASAPVVMTNTPPPPPELQIGPDEASQFDTISCNVLSPEVDFDLDPLSYTFTWTLNGSAWTGDTTSVHHEGDAIDDMYVEIGQEWSCAAIASDGMTTSPEATSDMVEIIDGWPAEIVFTNCGATGATGPSQVNCDAAYTETTLDGKVTVDEGLQTWTAPVTGTYFIEARGAEAETDSVYGWGTAGKGAIIEGEFELERGQTLTIAVGQQGRQSSYEGGGGGGSWVMDGDEPVIIAGGGGGMGRYASQRYHTSCSGSTVEYATLGYMGSSSWGGGCSGPRTDRLREGGETGSGSMASCQYGDGGGGIDSNGGKDTCTSSEGGGSWESGLKGGVGTAQGGFGGGGGSAWSGGGGGGYSGGNGSRWGAAGGGGSYNAGTNKGARAGNSGHGSVLIDLLEAG